MSELIPLQTELRIGLTGPEEIIQNIRMIITTPRGSVPLDRDFGSVWSLVDQPEPRAVAAMTTEILEQVYRYEPRARVTFIGWEQTNPEASDGKLIPLVYAEILE